MKLTDYVIDFFVKRGIYHGFVLQGGAVAHLIDSGEKHSDFSVIAMQHEQAAAMAADAYGRVVESGFGLAMATSGPGATNLITGIACSYYDSIPTIFVTGNVASFRQSDRIGVRQYGFQETDICDICRPITKYVVRLSSPDNIQYQLEKALYIAKEGRPGPVLIDIPDDFQRASIDVATLSHYQIDHEYMINSERVKQLSVSVKENVEQLLPLIKNAKRPVLVLGAGLIAAGAQDRAIALANTLSIPFLYTWALKGCCDWFAPLCAGTFGTNSPRYGNFAIQNADLIISLGSRLDTHATGKLEFFARESTLVIVDIDNSELEKFEKLGRAVDYLFNIDASIFIDYLAQMASINALRSSCLPWLQQIVKWKQHFQPRLEQATDKVDPYQFFKQLSERTSTTEFFTLDTGAGLAYFMSNYYESKGQRVLTAFNNTPMGYALPAAIGAAFATDKKQAVVCISGDGGLQINIQELATVAYHQLPIKIIVVNNAGHSMIKQTQDDWLESNYFASSAEHGLPTLHFVDIANAYGIAGCEVWHDQDVSDKLVCLFADNRPYLLDIQIDPDVRIDPMIKWGRPLEDASPVLSREILSANMYLPLIELPDSQ